MNIDLETMDEKAARLQAGYRSMRGERLHKIVENFIDKQDIYHAECIYQNDNVIENAYEFIEALCNVVGYKETEEE
jgi:hypothetical protein